MPLQPCGASIKSLFLLFLCLSASTKPLNTSSWNCILKSFTKCYRTTPMTLCIHTQVREIKLDIVSFKFRLSKKNWIFSTNTFFFQYTSNSNTVEDGVDSSFVQGQTFHSSYTVHRSAFSSHLGCLATVILLRKMEKSKGQITRSGFWRTRWWWHIYVKITAFA
jgi:hypothetical protein